jgi:hypothetical protein
MAMGDVEVGGLEYVIDDRTGRQLYYDVNALSNFVADPVRIVGFNPYSRLADFLIAEAVQHEARISTTKASAISVTAPFSSAPFSSTKVSA